MAPKITSSSDRSKRQSRSKATVRSDKGRSNRQKASTAKPTSSKERTNTNSARVTRDSQRASTGSAKVTRSEKPALPAGKKGGPIQSQRKGGAIVRTGSKNSTPSSTRIEQVSVRDVTKGGQKSQMSGSNTTRTLPGSGAPASRPQSSARPSLPPGKAAGGGRMAAAGRGAAGAAIYTAGMAATDYIGKKAGTALGGFLRDQQNKPYRRQGEEQKPNPNSSRRPVKAGDAQTRFPNARRNAQVRTERIKAGIPAPKTANQGQATRQTEQRRSSGSTTATPTPRQSPARPSQAQPRSASGTAGTGRKWEDFNPGRGTSETNNPLMKNDSWLMSKIKEREDKQAKNVGPVKDGGEYSASKKAAEIVQRRKKKEEDEKKKQQP